MLYSALSHRDLLPDGFDAKSEKLPMIVYLPDMPEKKVPAVFTDCEKLTGVRAVVVIPDCPEGLHWINLPFEIMDMIEDVQNKYNTDPDKISLVGAGEGGCGAWEFAIHYANKLAALVPVSGGGMTWRATDAKGPRIWAFHGNDDDVCHKIRAQEMITSILSTGDFARLTFLEDEGHDIADKVFADGKVIQWLATCVRGEVSPEEVELIKEMNV